VSVPDQVALPALHDGVHARHSDAGENDLDARVSQDLVEQGWELRVPIPDEMPDDDSGVFQVHDQVAGSLGDPRRGRMRGSAKDPHATGGLLDDRQDALALAGQGDRLDEVAGQQRIGLSTKEIGPGGGASVGCGVDAVRLENLPDRGCGDLDAERGGLAVDPSVAP
jgi:hypothetical protein